jgi:hypothetical protein
VQARAMLTNVHRRAVGALMRYVESAPWYDKLTRTEQVALRQKVIDTINVYHDNCLDVVRSLDTDEISTNVRALELLESINAQVGQVTSRVERAPRGEPIRSQRPGTAVSG